MLELVKVIGFSLGVAFAGSYIATGIHKIIFKNKLSEGAIRLFMASLFAGVAYICTHT